MTDPYFIDKLDTLIDEFYDQFENEMGELIFIFMTEINGRHKRTPHEAAEEINCAIRGLDMAKLIDEEYDHYSYDDGFMDSQKLASQIMDGLMKRYTREF